MEYTKGIMKQTVIHSWRYGRSGKRSGQWQLMRLHGNTAVQIIHSVKTFLPRYSSMKFWTQSTRFVILWWGWLVCCCRNDPGFPVVTVTGDAGTKRLSFPSRSCTDLIKSVYFHALLKNHKPETAETCNTFYPYKKRRL